MAARTWPHAHRYPLDVPLDQVQARAVVSNGNRLTAMAVRAGSERVGSTVHC